MWVLSLLLWRMRTSTAVFFMPSSDGIDLVPCMKVNPMNDFVPLRER